MDLFLDILAVSQRPHRLLLPAARCSAAPTLSFPRVRLLWAAHAARGARRDGPQSFLSDKCLPLSSSARRNWDEGASLMSVPHQLSVARPDEPLPIDDILDGCICYPPSGSGVSVFSRV